MTNLGYQQPNNARTYGENTFLTEVFSMSYVRRDYDPHCYYLRLFQFKRVSGSLMRTYDKLRLYVYTL